MVVRRRTRAILTPLALYGVSALAVAYFWHHAHTGDRGLEAKAQLQMELAEMTEIHAQLKSERSEWERRIALLRSDQIDRDLLEERGRVLLGRVHRNDIVVITGP